MQGGRGRALIDPFAQRPKWQTWTGFIALVIVFVLVALLSPERARFYGLFGIASIILASGLLIASWIDLDRFILPDVLTLPLIAAGLGVAVYFDNHIWAHVLGAVLGYALIWALGRFWVLRFGREGIGLGDAKLLAAGGAWVGVFGLPIILLIASGGGLFLALILRRTIIPHTEFHLPFGPLLSLGIWVAWCVPFGVI